MNKLIGIENVTREDFDDVYVYNKVYDEARAMASKVLGSLELVSSVLPSQIIGELKYEYESSRLEYMGKFYEQFADYWDDGDSPKPKYDYTEENKERSISTSIQTHLGNAVLYDAEQQIVIVSCFLFSVPYYTSTYYYVFAETRERIESYVASVIANSRNKYTDSIMMMTDTSGGIEKKVFPKDRHVSLDGVVLDGAVKTEIVRSVESFFNQSDEFYRKYNIPYRRGILLYGKPGNGKTTLIKAISNSTSEPTVYWQVNEYTSSYSISDVFGYVKSIAPALLIIEDIDSLPDTCRSMFLNYLDGTHDNEGVFLIGTTNFPDKIDPALMNRAGRFDRAYEIKPPLTSMRIAYLQRKGLGNFVSESDVELAAELMDGFSMSMLNELYTLCAFAHHYDGDVDVRAIIDSLKDTKNKQQTDGWFNENKRLGFTPSM